MLRISANSLMKTLCLGPAGGRTIPCITKGSSFEGTSSRIPWREQTATRAFTSEELSALRRDSRIFSAMSSGQPLKNSEQGSFPSSVILNRHLRMDTAAAVAPAALKHSRNLAPEGEVAASEDIEKFTEVAHELADAAGEIIRQLFRTRIDILDKDDQSPVTIADRRAEEAMTALIKKHLPSHGIYGEESGLYMPKERTEYVWVLDPIDGTKSFITGKPLFGTLIALVHKGVPVLGIIDQPVLRERWVGRAGRASTLNGETIASRSSTRALKDAYLYTTSPHLFSGSKEEAFNRVRDKVKTPLYGCDCYAYGLLAAGHTDLVVESGLKPYDFLALIPVIEGAGGYITDWEGKDLRFWPTSEYPSVGEGGIEVAAAGSSSLHTAALAALDWKFPGSYFMGPQFIDEEKATAPVGKLDIFFAFTLSSTVFGQERNTHYSRYQDIFSQSKDKLSQKDLIPGGSDGQFFPLDEFLLLMTF